MPFYGQVQRLLPEENGVWEPLRIAFDDLLACMRRAPRTWQEDAPYHVELAKCLTWVGSTLQAAGLEGTPHEWETTAVSENPPCSTRTISILVKRSSGTSSTLS